jgi:hypothetical protein
MGALPTTVRAALWSTWLTLGLRLGWPRDGRRILGWELRRSEPNVALLGANSWIGMPAELLLVRQDDALLFCTFVQHDGPVARAVWAAIVKTHRRVVPRVLGHLER